MPMEELPINNNSGQSFGFILYQTELETFPKEIVIRNISDRAQVEKKDVSIDIGNGRTPLECFTACVAKAYSWFESRESVLPRFRRNDSNSIKRIR